jgi:hypothetical protein
MLTYIDIVKCTKARNNVKSVNKSKSLFKSHQNKPHIRKTTQKKTSKSKDI